ncbi:lipocalin family protein [Flavobacterium alkalisoli]|uniref:Lipocalin family protein n=1 Tax=Flavobacterium alkalisoli TaxID=2602769 RepID=A0A5B9FST1_9FLAO|nr:lipocalin family protein [Flavobacterium alkalisoli]QEE50080.1 lipocalin family protein [Flavobacterium alkalisoli]
MKKLVAVLFVALAFACSSDDDVENVDNGLHNPYTGDVLGEWKVVAVSYDGEEFPLGCELETPTEQDVYFTFLEDNTFTVEHNCGEALPYYGGTYTKTGNVLTLIFDNDTEEVIQEKAHMVVVQEDDPETEEVESFVLEWRFGIGNSGMLENFDVQVEKQVPLEETPPVED